MATVAARANIAVSEAERLIREAVPSFGAERVPLAAAAGRILAAGVLADREQPPFNRATMDGIAIRWVDWQSGRRAFRISGIQPAGKPAYPLAGEGTCVEIMTGAVVPDGADAVIPVEQLTTDSGVAHVLDSVTVKPWQSIHRQGTDCSAGYEWVAAGMTLNGPRIALAASAGYNALDVARIPRVAIVSTGDELVDIDDAVEPHQIRRSNSYGCAAALRRHVGIDASLHHFNDDQEVLFDGLMGVLAEHDVVVLSGGVSMGKYDYVPEALERAGVTCIFHRVTQRPGKPMWFGTRGDRTVFGLPGNPVSALTCLCRYVVPALVEAMGGRRQRHIAALAAEVPFRPALTYFAPVTLTPDDEGRLWAQPHTTNTSGDHGALAPTDGFLELPLGQDVYPQGFAGTFYSW